MKGLRVVRAGNPSPMTLDGTRTYIVGRQRVVVIDPGPEGSTHVGAVAALVEGAQSIDIVITHHHADHAGAAAELGRLVGGRIRAWGAPIPGVSAEVERVSDGDVLETDSGRLTVLDTPGHTQDHIALLWDRIEGGRAVFVGDLLLGEGDTSLVAAPEGNVVDYLRSLERLESLAVDTLYPTHGDPLEDPTAAIRRFRDHRLQRVDQVRRLLADDPRMTTPDIVEQLYGTGLPPRLRDAASGSVEAIRSYLSFPDGLQT